MNIQKKKKYGGAVKCFCATEDTIIYFKKKIYIRNNQTSFKRNNKL